MLAIVLALLVALQSPASSEQRWVVERGRVGPVLIGAAAESIYSHFGDRARLIDLKLEGHLSPALEIRLFGSQLVGCMSDEEV
jgi:hypothetical protein